MIPIYLTYYNKGWGIFEEGDFIKLGKLEQHLFRRYEVPDEIKSDALQELEKIRKELETYEIIPNKKDSWMAFPDLRTLS